MLSESVIEHFDNLQAGYLAKLAEQVDILRQRAKQLAPEAEVDHDTIASLITQLRNLAGSGATFDLSAVSSAARRGEQLLTEVLDGHLEWNDSTQQVLNDTLLALAEAVANARQALGTPQGEPSPDKSALLDEPSRLLYYSPDQRLDEMATTLVQFGYHLKKMGSLDALDKQLQEYRPDILVLPFSPAVKAQLAKLEHPLPPTVFVAEQHDFATRLAALRAGGRALLSNPPDSDQLAAVLAELFLPPGGADYKVAVLDPDPELGRYRGLMLERAGMRPAIVQQPQALLDHLKISACNAIVSSLRPASHESSACDGIELAALLQQVPEADGIPIIFLADKKHSLKDPQIDTLRAAGHDYLKHKSKPELLIQTVANHARIHRAQSILSQRDSLTGLLNYHALHKALEKEILRAHRHEITLSIGLLNLDHLKRVNDGFGYAAGNSVIKSLAHLLTQRLRRSDVVGRLEGDVILILLPDTGADAARQVLNVIRKSFSSLPHSGSQGEFTVSLSGGVAQLQDGEPASALLARADTALYQAKRGGRNLIK